MRNFHLAGRSTVFSERGMCATSHPLAASAAVDVLKKGGNAVDAAIAGAVLLGICEPHMTGIGGDCFALVKPAGSDTVVGLNGSGRAPRGLDPEALRAAGHQRMPEYDAAAVTVPGAIAGFAALSERFGALGLGGSLAPAIDYAEAGVPVAPRVAFDWASQSGTLGDDARRFYLYGGKPPRVGQVHRAPGMADVLRRIANEGASAFYTGTVAEDMLGALRAAGGTHTEEDFAACSADWTEPVSSRYRDIEVVEHPPNGQGGVALLMLNLLERFDVSAMDPWGAERVQLEAEITRLAYSARNRLLADPASMDTPNALLDPALADQLADEINLGSRGAGATSPTESPHRDTVLITVVDRDRMAVSLIYSIFHSFGSGIASPRHGILLHNRGAGFSLEKGHPNEAGPGKRPMHTIIPGMLRRNGRIVGAFGVMGGQYQAVGHARFVSNLTDFGLDPQEAIDAPRAFAIDGELRLEHGYSAEVKDRLTDMGQTVVHPAAGIGGAQAILIDPDSGVLTGGSDPRKDGIALGY